ncbi:MAG: hypothetical protein CSA34_06200 [Desulfobulbus propionicus]|nr:MAG: hypothetical protein CSA34_06200 [Desulfobulbus propionicus]
MAEQKAFDPNRSPFEKLHEPQGLLEHLNLPPKAVTFIRKHQRTIWVVVILLALTVTAVSLYTSYRERRIAKGAAALETAMAATADKDMQLQGVIDEYGSTPSGIWARIELARYHVEQGERQQGIAELEAVKKDLGADSSLLPLVLLNLGGLHEEEDKLNVAVAEYEELSRITGFSADAWFALGRVAEEQGKPQEAVSFYQKYLGVVANKQGSIPDSRQQMVEERIGRLQKQ